MALLYVETRYSSSLNPAFTSVEAIPVSLRSPVAPAVPDAVNLDVLSNVALRTSAADICGWDRMSTTVTSNPRVAVSNCVSEKGIVAATVKVDGKATVNGCTDRSTAPVVRKAAEASALDPDSGEDWRNVDVCEH